MGTDGPLKIVHLEDSKLDAELVRTRLDEDGISCSIDLVDTRGDFAARIGRGGYDIILADYTLPSFDGLTALKMVRERDRNTPFIFVSGTIGEDKAVETFKNGATDYVLKSHLSRLAPAVRRALKEKEEKNERKRTEDALRQSEIRLRTLLKTIPDLVWLKDVNGVYQACNVMFERFIGAREPDIVGKTDYDFVAKELADFFREHDRRAIAAGTSVRNEEWVTFADDGRRVLLDTMKTPMRDAGGNVIGVLGIGRDITERYYAEDSLRESEARYRSLFDNMLEGFAYCKLIMEHGKARDFVYLAVNGAFEKLTGLRDVVGKKVTEVVPGIREANPELFEVYGRVASTGKPERFETFSNAFGGWLSISVYSTEPEHFVAVFDNITERKISEEKLHASVQQWNNTFDAMNDIISVLDDRGTILMVNQATLKLFRKPHSEIIGKSHWEIVHPAEGTAAECPFTRMQGSHRRESAAMPILKRWFHVAADPILDPSGKLIGGVHVMTDITEHRQFEERLRESESKFRTLAEQSLVGTYVIQDDLFKYVNPRFAEMFGHRVEEIIDRKGPYDFVVSEDRHIVAENIEKRMSGKIPSLDYEFRGRKGDGEVIHVEAYGSHAFYQGKPAIIGVILDITEKKKLESQLRQAQKMEAIGTLAGGIAHDFNNILSAIMGYGQVVLMDMPQDDPQRRNIESIIEAADRAAYLTQGLLAFSRKQVDVRKPVSLNAAVKGVEKFLMRVIGEDIGCRTTLHDGELTVLADAHQLEQVLMNLATNARDAMPKGGVFTMTTGRAGLDEEFIQAHGYGKPGNYALMTIADTGMGMNEETRQRIFDPFFTTKEVGKGTGLGLAVVYGIIKQHDGFINVYSEPGAGTTFRIYLPLIAAGAAEEKEEKKTEQPRGGAETVLLAEDDESLRKLSTMVLEHFGYTVIPAVDGEDAVKKFIANQDRIRLLLFDLIMPNKGGKEAYDEIRKIQPGIPAIFSSGYSPDMVRQKVPLESDVPLVFKPISPTDLLKKVRSVLDEKRK